MKRFIIACVAFVMLLSCCIVGLTSHQVISVEEEFARAKAMLLEETLKADSSAIVQARQRFERLLQNEHFVRNDSLTAWAHSYVALADWLLTFVTYGNQEGQKQLMDDALAHLEVAITLKKDLVDAYALMRRCVQWRSMLDPGTAKALKPEQRSALDTARSLAPDHPLVILEEALDLFYKPASAGGDQPKALARFREAIARFQELQKNDPAYMKWWQAMTYMILGRSYLGTEKPEKAERAFQAALALEPNFEMVKSGLLPMTQLVTMPPVRNFQDARWTTLAADAANDGKNPAWPDVNILSLYDDPEADTLWLKLDLSRFPNPNVFGINLVIDADQNQHNGAHWWGGNNSFKYDKLISVWVVKVGEHAYRGTVGIADVSGIQLNRYTNLYRNNIVFSAESEKRTMLLGVKRTEVDDDGNFDVVAAVGSNIAWNDDIPDSGAVEIRSKK